MEDKRASELSVHHKLLDCFHARSRIILTFSPIAFFHNISSARSQHVKWSDYRKHEFFQDSPLLFAITSKTKETKDRPSVKYRLGDFMKHPLRDKDAILVNRRPNCTLRIHYTRFSD